MNKRQHTIVRRFVQVQRFLEDHPGALPPEGEQLCERLDAVIAAVTSPPDRDRHSPSVVAARNIEHGIRVVRMLDMLVRPMLAYDRQLLSQWEAAKRRVRKGQPDARAAAGSGGA